MCLRYYKRIRLLLVITAGSLLLIISAASSVFASREEASESETDRPPYPGFSVRLYIEGEADENGCYVQNWDAAAQYPIADIRLLTYVTEITNDGGTDLEDPVTSNWVGDIYSTTTGSDGVIIPAGKATKFGTGALKIDENDVERGYIVLRAECTAKCPDPAYAGTVSASDEIIIQVCARPEKDIIEYLETEFGGALSEEELADYYRGFFGDRYDRMRERVMAEEQKEIEDTEGTETGKEAAETAETAKTEMSEELQTPEESRGESGPGPKRAVMIAALTAGCITVLGAAGLIARMRGRKK